MAWTKYLFSRYSGGEIQTNLISVISDGARCCGKNKMEIKDEGALAGSICISQVGWDGGSNE
jgi:hypothetical protein